MNDKITYKDAGVDIAAADSGVSKIAKLARSTFTPNVIRNIGLFGAFYKFDAARYRQPVLVSSVDGVGTKLKIAFMSGIHDTVGEDLVNHCVNDIMTSGAEPLFFLDYLAFGKLDNKTLEQIVIGLVRGCKNANCSLIGGETAEMPDFYQLGEYDISGTIVGVVENDRIIDGGGIVPGDVLIGVPSNGLHTNGYSLVRKIFFDIKKYQVTDYISELGCTLSQELLRVHRSYQDIILMLKEQPFLKGMSHITGGGIVGNTIRILPPHRQLKIDWNSWEQPPIFDLIQKLGNVATDEMRRVFNLGVGFIFIIDKNFVSNVGDIIKGQDIQPIIIGEVS